VIALEISWAWVWKAGSRRSATAEMAKKEKEVAEGLGATKASPVMSTFHSGLRSERPYVPQSPLCT